MISGERLLKVVLPDIVPFDVLNERSDGKKGVIENIVLTGLFTIMHDISIS